MNHDPDLIGAYNLRQLQQLAVETGCEVFGEANTLNPQERLLRFGEEAMELMRARGLKFQQVAALACHEFKKKEPGETSQEIAGVQFTLLSLANAAGVDAQDAVQKELLRVLANKEKCRAKHNAKPGAIVAQGVTAA
jgi:hypothetical protein